MQWEIEDILDDDDVPDDEALEYDADAAMTAMIECAMAEWDQETSVEPGNAIDM